MQGFIDHGMVFIPGTERNQERTLSLGVTQSVLDFKITFSATWNDALKLIKCGPGNPI